MKLVLESDLRKTDIIRSLQIEGEPSSMPAVPDGFEVVCYIRPWLVTCDTLEDILMLYRQYHIGLGTDISWYLVRYVNWFFDYGRDNYAFEVKNIRMCNS